MKLADFQAVLLDMDGTIYRDRAALPGAPEAMEQLRRRGIIHACITNAAWHTPQRLSAKLAEMGVTLDSAHIYTAGNAMADWLRQRSVKPRVCCFTGPAVESMLADIIVPVTRPDEACDVVALASHIHEQEGRMDLPRVQTALWHLRTGAELLVSSADRVYPVQGGYTPGAGSFAAMFIYAAVITPDRVHFAGKPSVQFFQALCRRLHVDPRKCLLIGDNLESDIRGGKAAGMTTALVFSGVTQPEDLRASEIQPDMVAGDLATLLQVLDRS